MNLGEEVKIYVKFNGKKPTCNKTHNQDLVRYLRGNIDTLNGCGNFVDLLLIDENDDRHLEKVRSQQGVKRLPVLICVRRPTKIYGTPKIKNFLKDLCRRKTHLNPRKPDEEIRDYQMSLMGCGMSRDGKVLMDDKDDNQTDAHIENMARATGEWQKRKDVYKRNENMSAGERRATRQEKRYRANPENDGEEGFAGGGGGNRNVKLADNPAALQRMMGSKDMSDARDNDLMAQFWENNTETKVV